MTGTRLVYFHTEPKFLEKVAESPVLTYQLSDHLRTSFQVHVGNCTWCLVWEQKPGLSNWGKQRLNVSENRVPRRICRHNMEEWQEAGELYNEGLHTLYNSPNIIRVRMRMWEVCSMHGEIKNTFKILVTNPEGKRSLRSFNYSWRVILKLS